MSGRRLSRRKTQMCVLSAHLSSALRCCCRAAARSAPIRLALIRRWREADLHPDWVAGISIGALNSALIAGNSCVKNASRNCGNSGKRSPPLLWHVRFQLVRGSRASSPTVCSIKCIHSVRSLGGAPSFSSKLRMPPPYLYPNGTLKLSAITMSDR